MKKLLVLISVFAFLTSCKKETTKKQMPVKTEGYHIIGSIKKFNDKTVFLTIQNLDKSYKTIEKTTISNNTFNFNGTSASPKLMYLGFENSEHKIPVITNNFETFVTINSKDLDKTSVLGSPLQTNYTSYLNGLVTAKNKFVYQLDYIKTNSNSLLSAIVLKQMLGKTKWRLGQNRKAYENLSTAIKSSELGESINSFLVKNEPLVKDEKIVEELSLNPEVANIIPDVAVIKESPKKEPEVLKIPKVKKVVRRRKAINFSAESQHGGDISLNQVKRNAKVTLIDFWASWCGPCRESNPHLIRLYNKYHSKGFNIIGVSEDKLTDKSSWHNAIAVDALPWQQVIDDYGRIAEIYNVSGIPHTVLIDSKGGIIFQKKSTYTIEKKLKEIFGF